MNLRQKSVFLSTVLPCACRVFNVPFSRFSAVQKLTPETVALDTQVETEEFDVHSKVAERPSSKLRALRQHLPGKSCASTPRKIAVS